MSEGQKGITRRAGLQGSMAAGLAAALPIGAAAAPPGTADIQAVIDAAKTGEPISKLIYGSFSEHIQGFIYGALWAEVLGDRKFYYAVDAQDPSSKWRPLAAAQTVTMDTAAPYVGDHSPVVALSPLEPRGIGQGGLALAAKDYVGRIVVAGDPGAHLVVTLSWGSGQSQRVVVPVRRQWTTVPLRFSCRAATTDGRLELSATGTGSLKIGAVSLMAADNVHGFRNDTIALFRAMDSGMWRFPGGNFTSGHDWKDAVGDPDRRPPKWDYVWNYAQSNDIGTDEFLTLCRLIAVEPYLCVNSGFGSAREAAELVEYVNGDAGSPMGRARAANGHPEPYKVKYWNIGNEMFGFWQLGYMTPSQYVMKHTLFAKAMKKADPSITLVAVGASPASLTIHSEPFYIDPDTRKIVHPSPVIVEYGSDVDWNHRLMKNAWGTFDIISEHTYGDPHRYDLTTGQRVEVDESVLDSVRRGANYIHAIREDWELYKKDFPLERDNIKMSLDEWAYFVRGLRGVLAVGLMLHEMFRNTDFIVMGAYTTGMSWLSYNATDSTYSEQGLLFLLYRKHFGTIPVEISGNSPQPAPKWPAGGDQPSVTSGSPTYPLDMSAALSADRKTLTIAVINATADVHSADISLAGFAARGRGRLWRLTGPGLDSGNQVGQPPQVTVTETEFDTGDRRISVEPYSVELRSYFK
jgi:alpha-N-arabinofuranosidase